MSMPKKKEEKKEKKIINKEAKKSLLEHYSNEVCSHIEAAISLFFGLIGNLFLLTVLNSLFAKIVFSFSYFVLGILGVYFYIRLFYYRKLLDRILLDEPFKDYYIRLERSVLEESVLIKWARRLSRFETGKYRMIWAWAMLTVAIVVAIFSWAIVVFSL